jgi:hypothetical protein
MVLAAALTRAEARAAPASRPDVADIRTVPRQPTEGQTDKGVHVEFIQTTLDSYPVLSHVHALDRRCIEKAQLATLRI